MPTDTWQKSSFSGDGGNCVNVAATGAGAVCLRESDDPGNILTVAPAALHGLIRAAKAGQLPSRGGGRP
ncbi:DUF397 domain-containing protein [Streptomyces sp. NPDC046261]|uniref:DUF397 domain-containing protein n=1 Tax=Streptomyces sp. NPDC046261 TaxID=3157200 RepID=UPI0033D42EE3